MNNIETLKEEVWIIRFMNSSHIEIAKERGEKLQDASLSTNPPKMFKIDGVVHAASSIVFIGSMSKYKEQFPDEISTDTHQPYIKLPPVNYEQLINYAIKISHIDAMLRGFDKSFEGKVMSNDSKRLRELMIARKQELEQT